MTGALQRHNRVDIEELLNLVEETANWWNHGWGNLRGSNGCIWKAPEQWNHRWQWRQFWPNKPCPTATEALHSISLITNYTDTINDPIAQKLEGVLGCFRCQIHLEKSRAMKEHQQNDILLAVLDLVPASTASSASSWFFRSRPKDLSRARCSNTRSSCLVSHLGLERESVPGKYHFLIPTVTHSQVLFKATALS